MSNDAVGTSDLPSRCGFVCTNTASAQRSHQGLGFFSRNPWTMASSINGDAQAALEKSRKEKKEASMKRIIKVVEAEKEVRQEILRTVLPPYMCV